MVRVTWSPDLNSPVALPVTVVLAMPFSAALMMLSAVTGSMLSAVVALVGATVSTA